MRRILYGFLLTLTFDLSWLALGDEIINHAKARAEEIPMEKSDREAHFTLSCRKSSNKVS